eukprot:EG_transcript_362
MYRGADMRRPVGPGFRKPNEAFSYRYGRQVPQQHGFAKVSEHNWDNERGREWKKTHWDSAQEWAYGAQEEKYPPYLGPDNSTWHGGGGEQRSRGMDPQQAFYEETYPQFEEGYYEEPFVEPIKHSHGHNYGPPDHRLPWISPGEGYASTPYNGSNLDGFGSTQAVETQDFPTTFAVPQADPVGVATHTLPGRQRPMPERKGLDIVNPQTGEKVVVQHSSDKKEVTEGTKPLGRGPLPITNPNTGERLAFAQLLSDASQAGTGRATRGSSCASSANEVQPSQVRMLEERLAKNVPEGLRKLDAQSLNDLARQHHEEDARRERRRAPSVPSPDSLSMDDTPGPSDEERESARSFRRPAFRLLEERFRSRSASPRLYHLYCDHSPAATPRIKVSHKVYSEAALRKLNDMKTKIPTLLYNPKLSEIVVYDTEEYLKRCMLREEDAYDYGGLDQTGRDSDILEAPEEVTVDTVEEGSLIRKIIGILNKLTPEKYHQLLQSMYEILDTNNARIHETLLERIIGEVHECALEQPNYSEMYAALCSDICIRIHGNEQRSGALQFSGEGQGQSALENFRRILLNRCQARFLEGLDHLLAKFNQARTSKVESETDEKEEKFRSRSKNNIRFIGELFKSSMLSERIMHKVIKRLLLDIPHTNTATARATADGLDVLCTLLRTAGKELDHPRAAEYMAHYFTRFHCLAQSHPLPRIRFMVLDIIALRDNQWVERRKDTGTLKFRHDSEDQECRTPGKAGHQSRGQWDHCDNSYSHFEQPEMQGPTGWGPRQPPQGAKDRGGWWGHGGYDGYRAAGASRGLTKSLSTPVGVRPREHEWRHRRHNGSVPDILDGRTPVTEEDLRFDSKAQMMLDEWHITGQDVGSVLVMMDEVPVHALHQFWVCALEFTSRTNKYERYRANLVLLIQVFVQHGRLTIGGLVGSLMDLVDRACRTEVWVDSPGLWHNLAGMLVELMAMGILVFDHLLDICTPFFHQQQDGACRDFLMSIMHVIQVTRQLHLYNAQAAFSLAEAFGAWQGHAHHPGRLGLAEFVDRLGY